MITLWAMLSEDQDARIKGTDNHKQTITEIWASYKNRTYMPEYQVDQRITLTRSKSKT